MMNDYEEFLEEVRICDHPGFNESRGSEFKICTYMSMDRAIDLSQSIASIVLVIPYGAFW